MSIGGVAVEAVQSQERLVTLYRTDERLAIHCIKSRLLSVFWFKQSVVQNVLFKLKSVNSMIKEVNVGMTPATYSRFIRFLQEDLALSASSIAVALRHRERDQGPLPMILWQYGLVTLEQLDRIFDWLETAQP